MPVPACLCPTMQWFGALVFHSDSTAIKISKIFFRTGVICFLLLSLVTTFLAGAEIPLRQTVPLNDRWLFQLVDAPMDAVNVAAWKSVDLPHTWNAEDGSEIGKPYRRGYGYYQRSFLAESAWTGKRVFLSVGAANAKARVYCNNQLIGEHRTGFTAFRFDLTDAVRWGEDNALQIEVDNRASLEYPPIVSDYTFFGGIYRDVSLIIVENPHISLSHFGSNGVYLRQTTVDRQRAEIASHVWLSNRGAQAVDAVRVGVRVVDHAGKTVIAVESPDLSLAAGSHQEVVIPFTLLNPRLWHGRSDPYLYRVETTLLVAGAPRDRTVEPLGVRSFAVDPERGFILNGQPYDLYGVSLHQDRAGKGWAISDADRAEDVGLIREIGATCVRLVHYPHAPATVSLLDTAGIVAWSEIPLAYRLGKMPEYLDSCSLLLSEMVHQLYNHPSICFWGLFNEMSGAQEANLKAINHLNTLTKTLDPTRLTTAAAGAIEQDPACDVPDVIAFNRYFGWYVPGAGMFEAWADGGKKLFPQRRFGIAEYGADGILDRHADHRTHRTNFQLGIDSRMGTEEYQTYLHERAWGQLHDKRYLWCKLVWNLADWSRGGIRNPTVFPSAGIGRKGLVTHDRSIRKDSFFWYKANWSKEPVLHIAEARFTPREFKEVDLRVYSNIGMPSVSINGVPLTAKPIQTGIRYLWPNLVLPVGAVRITAQAKSGARDFTSAVAWEIPDALPVKKVVPAPPPEKKPGF